MEYLLGGINILQDLHFSSFYLRASLSSCTLPDYPGYTRIVSFYEEGTEHYYIPAREAEHCSRWLTERSLGDPQWLEDKLESIEERSRSLGNVFQDGLDSSIFRDIGTKELISMYLRHNAEHRALYQVARLPEALDRGIPFFSDYLRNYLRQLGVPEMELHRVFSELTAPQIPSVIAEEELAFRQIIFDASASAGDLTAALAPIMHLPPHIREALREHRDRWGWLSYHGYRNRGLPSEHDLVGRLCEALRVSQLNRSSHRAYAHSDGMESILAMVDAQHRELFRLYSEIGRVKLARRYWQLRNFYFLDHLLEEFARRLRVTEWEIRCCLPEEVVVALERGSISSAIGSRLDRCAIVFTPEGETVFGAHDAVALRTTLPIRNVTAPDPSRRSGVPACIGLARGTARVVGKNSIGASPFRGGQVLVCEAADPDLLPMIRRAAAVVTQQGGVTSHASILCREVGVPTLVGVDGLLDFIRDGDDIEVDATQGWVKRIKRDARGINESIVVPRELWDQARTVGQKARNLTLAERFGFRVPPFTVLSFRALTKMLTHDSASLRREFGDIISFLGSPVGAGGHFLLRSSAIDEDNSDSFRAGAYASVRFAQDYDPLVALREFVEKNSKLAYQGGVILQWFVPASACGVSMEDEPRANARDKLVVEFVRGPINTITFGAARPQRLVYNLSTAEISAGVDSAEFDTGVPLGYLVEWLCSVGRRFGRPTYTEWGFFRDQLWLYQARGST